MNLKPHSGAHPFPTTRWTLILLAGAAESAVRKQVLEELCALYWLPIYAFARRKGLSPVDAEDATQGFLSSFVVRNDFTRTDENVGRMRSYLLGAFTNFLNTEHRNRNRQKRGGGIPLLSLQEMESEERYAMLSLPSEETTPELIFDQTWAHELLDSAIQQVGDSFDEKGKQSQFEVLRPFLRPSGDEPPYEEIAGQLGVSPGAVTQMIQRMRAQYRDAVKERVKDTLVEGANADEEIRALIAILCKS